MRRLTRLGVDVRLGVTVQVVDEEGVIMGNERVQAKTVVWTAGVAPSPAGKWLGTIVDHAGRVRIQSDLTVSEHPNIFVVGDTASLDQDGRALPGVAQVAIQQGRYAAMSILRRVRGHSPLPRFRYFRQRQSCCRGSEFRGSAECGSPIERQYGVARVGFYTYPILGRS